ncbi:MAG: hypothetical protein LBD46_00550 [Endomicrobium sp.]|jgi:hypothetical protein|nr:hypothetical protein [Endomicrobium sp.]
MQNYLKVKKEEEIKRRIAVDIFKAFDTVYIIGNIDFCVSRKVHVLDMFENRTDFFWAESKKGKSDIYASITQLILTIGKAKTYTKELPPMYIGAFDAVQIAFVPYSEIQHIFSQNDFNWNVTPSDHTTKEFKQIYSFIKESIDKNAALFDYERDESELKQFINNKFKIGNDIQNKIKIDKNNYIVIYNKWREAVKPTISINWDDIVDNLIDADFYLADLLSAKNITISEKLFVLLNDNRYNINKRIDKYGLISLQEVGFRDKGKAHTQFWNRYEHPPKEEYWEYIVNRRDLLVSQDVREIKGAYFTPQIWVEKAQQYLADVLGENWQDDYYIWDCAAGTGNLLTGLSNKYNIYASTLDKQDVNVMYERIDNGANLLKDNVFQFDFLNDDFSKLPQGLQEIINNPQKRKKLVIFINPPYAEAGNVKQRTGTGKNKDGVAKNNKSIYYKYSHLIGKAANEVFAQFLIRIYFEIAGCKIAEFSKLKLLSAPNFARIRQIFKAKLEKMFVVPSYTFDNVDGHFPIGFKVWDTDKKECFVKIKADVYIENGDYIGQKTIYSYDDVKGFLSKWLVEFKDKHNTPLGMMNSGRNDFQNQRLVYIKNQISDSAHSITITPTLTNIIPASIYFAVRKCIPATWLNDRDQFLYPIDGWEKDTEFHNDCLVYTLFNNNIQAKYGINHWIPYTERDVNARNKFESHFMYDFIKNRKFSTAAEQLLAAGLELWKYYHSKITELNVAAKEQINAGFYDIKEYFQGRNEKGKMNNKSNDAEYMRLIKAISYNANIISKKIEPKIYQYEFLKK